MPARNRPLRRVLVVDDLPEFADSVARVFRGVRDYDVRVTTEINSVRALALAKAEPFDLVVSDFRMGAVDGLRLLAAHHERNPDGRRVLMSAYDRIPATVESMRAAHVDAYLHKPIEYARLRALALDMLDADDMLLAQHRDVARDRERDAERRNGP